jgi:hypothetical protein
MWVNVRVAASIDLKFKGRKIITCGLMSLSMIEVLVDRVLAGDSFVSSPVLYPWGFAG